MLLNADQFYDELYKVDKQEASFRPKRYFMLREELLQRNRKQHKERLKSMLNEENTEKEVEEDRPINRIPPFEKDYLEWRKFLLQQKRKTGFMHKVQLSPLELLRLMESRRRSDSLLTTPSSVLVSGSQISSTVGDESSLTETSENDANSLTNSSTTEFIQRRTNVSTVNVFQEMHRSFVRGNPWTTKITRVQFANNDSNLLAFASSDGCISVASVSQEQGILCELVGHTDSVLDIAWSSTNDILLSVSKDLTIRIWNISNFSKLTCLRVITEQSIPTCVAFHPFNSNIFVVGFATQKKKLLQFQESLTDSAVVVYNMSTGKPVVVTNKELMKTATSMQKIGGGSGGIQSLANIKESIRGRSGVTCLAFSTHADLLFVGDAKCFVTVFRWDAQNGLIKKNALECKKISETGQRITSLHYAQYLSSNKQLNSCLLINACDDNVHMYRISSGKTFRFELKRSFSIPNKKENIRSEFSPLLTYRSGAYIASGSESSEVYIFDASRAGNDCVQKLLGHSAPVVDISWSYDESFLASADISGVVIVWKRNFNASNEEQKNTFKREPDAGHNTDQQTEDDVDNDEVMSDINETPSGNLSNN
jgi:WD40 repeat protein